MLSIDGTIIFVIISFLIFLFIIKAILFEPITRILKERENFYDKNSKMENEAREKSKALLNEKGVHLNASRAQACEILKEAKEKSKQKNEAIIKEVKQKAVLKLEENEQILAQEIQNAKYEIKQEMEAIVKTIVYKIMRKVVEIKLDEKNIDEYLNR